jgi:hypothetical protein
VHELPYHAVVHFQATLSQFGDQTAQREVAPAAAFQQPNSPRANQLLRPIAADLAGIDTAGPAQPLHPSDRRADPHIVMRRCLTARQLALLDRSDNAFA